MPRLSNLRVVDPVLTNLAVGYNNAEMIAENLFPMVELEAEAGKIPVFGKEKFRIYNTVRALRAKSNRIQPENIDGLDIVLDEHDLEFPIDYREDAESAFPLQAWATDVVTEGIQLRREKYCADLAQNAANYATGNKITLSGTSQFTDSSSNPEGVISDAKAAIRSKIAKHPNTMVIGYEAARSLVRHPQLRGILGDNNKRLLRLEDLQDIFQIENIVIGMSLYAPTDGETVADIWGDNIVMAYVPKPRGGARMMYDASYGYTLRKKGGLKVDTYMEGGKVEIIRNTDIYRPYLLGAEGGYLISNTNG